MKTGFYFSDFTPDKELRFQADQALENILELAPYGSTAVALLKKNNEAFRCSVDVYSKGGPWIAHTTQSTPLLAIRHIQKILSEKLNNRRSSRGSVTKNIF